MTLKIILLQQISPEIEQNFLVFSLICGTSGPSPSLINVLIMGRELEMFSVDVQRSS